MNLKYYKRHYCSDIEEVENYEKALADNFKGWECHHRLETHTPDGKRRDVNIGYKELKALGLYYNRPAEELIFLTVKEHNAYQKGKHISEEHKKKVSEANKYNKHALGYHHSEETRKKISEAHKDKPRSEETRNKIGSAVKGNTNVRGRHWYNNGKISKRAYECPPGFVPGRIKKL